MPENAVFLLEEKNSGTLVKFIFDGFKKDKEFMTIYGQHIQAWLGALIALKCYIERDYDITTAWTEGKGNW